MRPYDPAVTAGKRSASAGVAAARRTGRVLSGLAIALALLAVVGCADDTTPEQAIRALVDGVEVAVESGSVRDAAVFLHDDYQDRFHPNRPAAMRSLLGYLHRHRDIHLLTVVRTIDVAPDGEHADAVVYVAMTGTPVESVETLIALKADAYRFDLQLARQDDEWRVRSAQWRRVAVDTL
ncbi:MAG: hypothetical protein H6955_21205 [Chromatiaceae bacterium]|nr:hypothetical protein [Chromatiaceae bacterium]